MSSGTDVRARAARAVAAISHGRSLDAVLPDATDNLPSRDAGLCRELVSGCVRHWYSLNYSLQLRLRKPLHDQDSDIQALLLLGLYQIQHLRIPDHAAVHETAGAARLLKKPWAVALINGVLRGVSRGDQPAPKKPGRRRMSATPPAEAMVDHPRWLMDLLAQAWPGQWQAMLRTNNTRAPMTLRCRPGEQQQILKELLAAGIDARPCTLAADGIQLANPCPVASIAAHAEGRVSVQDEGAQLAGQLFAQLAPQGARVLDACAAPGGKTAAVLERRPDLLLTALDHDAERSAMISTDLARLGLSATVATGDGRDPSGWWPGGELGAILLDAPCTGTGTLRRHPDIKLLRREDDVPAMAQVQEQLLDGLWPLLASGGSLLYCTCSVLPQENDAVIQAFVQRTPDARLQPAAAVRQQLLPAVGQGQPSSTDSPGGAELTGHGVQLLPATDGHDGFYFAVISKAAAGPTTTAPAADVAST